MPSNILSVNRRQLLTAAIASAFLTKTPTVALADYSISPQSMACSGKAYMTINGESYSYCADVLTSGGSATAFSQISAPRSLPAGQLGAYAVLYDASGKSLASSYSYSSSPGYSWTARASHGATSGVSYRALAYTYVYNQNTGGYYESDGVWSPFQTAYSINPYQYNERGQSYGSIDGFLSCGYYPDLILVQGISGVDGYVYKNDFFCPGATSLEEAIAYYSTSSSYTVDVYASDGITWVDSYEIQVGGGEAM